MRRASKLLITMLTLAVLFAIFAFSASAAEEITWDSNTAFGEANFDVSSDCTITVSGELEVKAQIRIRNGAKVTIKGDPTNGGTLKATGTKGQMFLVNNASVTFENITLDGGSKSRVIYVYDAAASATINAGTVIKNGKTTGTNPGAGIYNKGTVVMNGGSIESNNSASQAGGVYLYGGSSFTMNGGEIKNNNAGANGGGLSVLANATFTMNGGSISGNETSANGGAFISSGNVYLKGGEISGNTASNANAGAHASGGTMDIYYGFVFGTNYNASSSAAGSNVIIGGSATLNFGFEWNDAKQAETSLGGIADMKVAGQGIAYPTTRGTKNGVTYIIIDGEMEIADSISVPASAKIVLKGKNGTSDKLLYNGTSSNRALTVSNGAELTIENITVDVSGSANESGARSVVVASGGILNIKDGAVLTGGHGLSGAGVYNQGTVVMSGGSITGNNATGGAGGVNTNGENSSFTITGGSITNNTAAQEGAGIYVHSSGALVIGGNANITENTTLGKKSNICVDETCAAKTTIEADFAGTAGFHAEYRYTDDATTVKTLAVITSGYEFNAAQIFADDSNATPSATDGNLVLTSEAYTMDFTSPNGNVSTSTVKSDFYRLGALTAPDGYADASFVGYVKVSGYGTSPVAEALYKNGAMLTSEEFENLYPIWIKVEAEKGASVKLGEVSGIRFVATVDSAILEAVGIKVKASTTSGDGYYRGMVLATSATDLSAGLSKDNRQMDVKVKTATWGSALYKSFTGKTLASGKDSFSVAIDYYDASNYNKGIAFRAYVDLIVNGKSTVVYSEFVAPVSLVDNDNATYGAVHARSARATVRNLYFNGNTTEEQVKAATGSYYDQILAIAGYENFPVLSYPTAEQLAYYLQPISRGGDITDDDKIEHVVLFGDSLVCGHNMADTIEQLGINDNRKITISAMSYNSMGSSGHQTLKGLFNNDSSGFLDENGATTTDHTKFVIDLDPRDGIGSKFRSILEGSDTPVDKFYIFLTRDIYYGNGTGANAAKEILAIKAVANLVLAKFPDVQFIIVAPPAFGAQDFRITGSAGSSKYYSSPAVMQTAMNNASTMMANAITDTFPSANVKTFSLANYHASFALDGIDLFETSINTSTSFPDAILQRHPTMAGAYLNASLIYYDITGACPKGIDYNARVPAEEASALQAEVHRLIGCSKTSHDHTPLEYGVISGTGDYKIGNDGTTPPADKWNLLLATMLAYDARGYGVQYDQKSLNRTVHENQYANRDYRHSATHEDMHPENATADNILYSDCSDWVSAVFGDCFPLAAIRNYRSCADLYINRNYNGMGVFTWTDEDMTGTSNNNVDADHDGKYYAYVNGSSTASVSITTEEQARTYLINKVLRPGDVIVYIHKPIKDDGTYYSTFTALGGHVVVYIGNGLFMHCSGDQAGGGGSDYHPSSKKDLFEAVGGIQIDPIDILLDPTSPRYIFDEAAIAVLRPGYSGYDVSEAAQARVNGLLGIVASKTSTAPNGITVSAGGEVTFTVTVENRTEYLRDVSITDTLPSGLTHSSGGTLSGSTVSFDLTLKPFEKISVTYTATVNNSASGTIEMNSAYINGVPLSATSVTVADTLSSAEQTEFATLAASKKDSYTDAYSLAKAVYGDMGMTFTSTYSTASKLLGTVYTGTTTVNGYMLYDCKATMPIVADNLYGGLNLRATTAADSGATTDKNRRTKDLGVENFVVGDLIVYIPQNTATSTNPTFAGAQCYIYPGDGVFACYKDGAYTEIGGSAAVELLDSVLGEDLYCVARPSMVF